MQKNRAFTLIELMVVVGIIGILATIVVGMLNSAKTKGEDTAIREQLTSLLTQAELYATDNSNSYSSMFTNDNTWASPDPTVQAILDYIDDLTSVHVAGSGASAWAVQAQLKEDATLYACIGSDSGGVVIGETVMNAGDTTCP